MFSTFLFGGVILRHKTSLVVEHSDSRPSVCPSQVDIQWSIQVLTPWAEKEDAVGNYAGSGHEARLSRTSGHMVPLLKHPPHQWGPFVHPSVVHSAGPLGSP